MLLPSDKTSVIQNGSWPLEKIMLHHLLGNVDRNRQSRKMRMRKLPKDGWEDRLKRQAAGDGAVPGLRVGGDCRVSPKV